MVSYRGLYSNKSTRLPASDSEIKSHATRTKYKRKLSSVVRDSSVRACTRRFACSSGYLIAAFVSPSRAPLMACISHHSWGRSRMEKSSCSCTSTDRPEYCLNLRYMHALLRLGYEVEDSCVIETGKQIYRIALGWALLRSPWWGRLTCKT